MMQEMDKNNISGIFNYCDRWCERCTFTARCANFELGEKLETADGDRDEINKIFWELFEANLDDTVEKVDEGESEFDDFEFDNIEPNSDEEEYADDDRRIKHIIAKSHEASKLAELYHEKVSIWFEKNPEVVKNVNFYPTLKNKNSLKFTDSVEVVRWYQYQIYVKFMRAIQGKDEDMFETEFPKDSDGSAKVALIGIDRSISAWGNIFMSKDDKDEIVFNMLQLLVSLQHLVENEFPNARDFIRPGFDDKS